MIYHLLRLLRLLRCRLVFRRLVFRRLVFRRFVFRRLVFRRLVFRRLLRRAPPLCFCGGILAAFSVGFCTGVWAATGHFPVIGSGHVNPLHTLPTRPITSVCSIISHICYIFCYFGRRWKRRHLGQRRHRWKRMSTKCTIGHNVRERSRNIFNFLLKTFYCINSITNSFTRSGCFLSPMSTVLVHPQDLLVATLLSFLLYAAYI